MSTRVRNVAASMIAASCWLMVQTASANPDSALRTIAENSKFQKTGRYDEVITLCAEFAKIYPASVKCSSFGQTPQGRPMMALIVSANGWFTAQDAKANGATVLLVQGGIHAGEIDGKDAGFWFLRELLAGRVAKDSLRKTVLVFVPVFNVDGHERFGRWNRPNQRGPEEMGWRVTSQNYNLNRDYVKADSPEMQAMLGLINTWDPLVYVDLHVTDGAKFQHDISINVEPGYSGDAALRKAGLAMQYAMLDKLKKGGALPLSFYPSFIVDDDPSSGFERGVAPPRFSHGYMPLRNRFGMLVETHSWKDYARRVKLTYDTLVALLELTKENAAKWQSLSIAADTRAKSLGGQILPLAYKATSKVTMIDFLGFEYTRTPSEISGGLMTRYDETKPQVWRVPLHGEVKASRSTTVPRGGYIVPNSVAANVQARLKQHGIEYRAVVAKSSVAVQLFRADSVQFSPAPSEGHQRLTVEGSWKAGKIEIAPGCLFVPIAQPKARLVTAMFEPQAPDSLLAWGEFNAFFEQKEFMEYYVAEEVAREQLEKDPKLRKEFQKKLASDPEFAKDSGKRLDYFYRRHSSFDQNLNLYPIVRTDVTLR